MSLPFFVIPFKESAEVAKDYLHFFMPYGVDAGFFVGEVMGIVYENMGRHNIPASDLDFYGTDFFYLDGAIQTYITVREREEGLGGFRELPDEIERFAHAYAELTEIFYLATHRYVEDTMRIFGSMAPIRLRFRQWLGRDLVIGV